MLKAYKGSNWEKNPKYYFISKLNICDVKSIALLSKLDNFFIRLAFLVPPLLEISSMRNLDHAHPGSYTQMAS